MTNRTSSRRESTPHGAPQVVLAALRRAGAPTTADELATSTGLDPSTVRRTLGMLVATREARRAGGGRFTVARGGR